MNAAQTRLQALIHEIRYQQSPKTLAYWRLSNPRMVQALEAFAATATSTTTNELSLLEETQALFDTINPILAQQEAESPTFLREQRRRADAASASHGRIMAVVLGGKYNATPRSISELLVAKLAKRCARVMTISRTSHSINSNAATSLPAHHVTHMAKQHLDQIPQGVDECKDILRMATAEWADDNYDEFILYFTLGQHKGDYPFARNLQAAQNLAQAVLDPSAFVIPSASASSLSSRPWKVVLTGTDATLPSTHPDGSISLEIDGNMVDLTIPTYKIMPYNYTYAMSKLGQYYIVASAIAQRIGNLAVVAKCQFILEKIQQHVAAAGEDGDYHAETAILGMEQLDQISSQFSTLLLLQEEDHPQLIQHLQIAEGISICYTPLHARPWSEQACNGSTAATSLSRDEQKAYVLEQVVRRFKNAVSLEHAVASHL